MYCSLDKLDLVVETGSGKLGVQTDHRTAQEIQRLWDFSVVFLAIRVRRALLVPGIARVDVAFQEPPPHSFAVLARQLGAGVSVGHGEAIPAEPDPQAAHAVVSQAFIRLGERAFESFSLEMDLDGLRSLEHELRSDPVQRLADGDPPEPHDDTIVDVDAVSDEEARWRNVCRLAGAAMLVFADLCGGALHGDLPGDDGPPPADWPFRWLVAGGYLNLLGRASTFLQDDPNVAPSSLIQLHAERTEADEEDCPIMLNLRPKDWSGIPLAALVALLPDSDRHEPHDLPVVALVRDRPTSTESLPSSTPTELRERLREEALTNLRKVPVQVATVGAGPQRTLVVHGGFYAGERVLDVEYMRALGVQLGSDTLLAGLPMKGALFVRAANTSTAELEAFQQVIQRQYDDAAPSDRLATSILVLTHGRPTGVARPEAWTAPAATGDVVAPRKGFWARLFGGGDA